MAEPLHPGLSFAIDIADKAIKLLAVLLGGVWTYWNYKKSRTYAQKMELQLRGATFRNNHIYVEVEARLKNLGASRHAVDQRGSYCEVTAVYHDMAEELLTIRPVFTRDTFAEPGESINDFLLLKLPLEYAEPVWLRVRLRVVSQGLEWWEDEVIRLEPQDSDSS